ncbi:hypothetical protein ABBQ38_002588 [Trebouxia sp. C0009 RCD-2024]
MVAAAASLLSVRPVAAKPATQRPACRTRVVCAAARPEGNQQKNNTVAQLAAAGLAAALLMAQTPVFAAENYTNAKQRICASNPSAKICRVGSFQPKK